MGMLLVLLIVVCAVLLYRKHQQMFKFAENIEMHQSYVPVLGHLPLVLGKSREYTFALLRDIFLGHDRLFQLRLGLTLFVCSSHPDIVRAVLDNPKTMSKPKEYEFLQVDLGLLAAPYHLWKHQRKTLNSSFNKRILEGYVPFFDKCVGRMLERMKQAPDFARVNMMEYCSRCTMDMVFGSTFGTDVLDEPDVSELLPLIDAGLDSIAQRVVNVQYHPDFMFRWSHLYKKDTLMRNGITKYVNKIIHARRSQKTSDEKAEDSQDEAGSYRKPQIFINHLLEGKRAGEPFSDAEILDQSMTILVAGNDTTALGLCNHLTLLAMHPEVQERARQEILSVFPVVEGDANFETTPEGLGQLVYLEQCINEALRLCPSVSLLGRSSIDDVEVDGVLIPRGTKFVFNIAAIHRRRDLWGPDADRFDPDRFSVERSQGRHPNAFAPFSLGSRDCIGRRYAMFGMKLALVHLLRNFRFHTNLRYEEMEFKFDITNKLSQGYTFRLEPLRVAG